MDIQPSAIQRFFKETIPNAGLTIKTGVSAAYSAIAKSRMFNPTTRKIHAAVSHKEDWTIPEVPAKYSAAIKLLTTKVHLLGNARGEERIAHMLSRDEVSLILCCWIHQYRAKPVHESVQELFDALKQTNLLNKKSPWLPHNELYGQPALQQYMNDIKKPPTEAEHAQGLLFGNTVRSAIPGYLLELFDPVVLIPRSSTPPLHVAKGDIELLQALTPIHPTDDVDHDCIAKEMNALANDATRRAQFLAWWDAAPLQPVITSDGTISAKSAFLARTNSDYTGYGYSDIHDVIEYIRDPKNANNIAAYEHYTAKLQPPKQTTTNDSPLHELERGHLKIQSQEHRAEKLAHLLFWILDPVASEEIKASPRFAPLLLLLHDKDTIPLDEENIKNLVKLSNLLKNSYGSDGIKNHASINTLIEYIDKTVSKVHPDDLGSIDIETCQKALMNWHERETWTEEEMQTRYFALSTLQAWIATSRDITFPEKILEKYPKIEAIHRILQEHSELLERTTDVQPYSGRFTSTIISTISQKIEALSATLPKRTEKKDRLTLTEYYLLKYVASESPLWLTEETQTKWNQFTNTYLGLAKDAVFVNFAKPLRDPTETKSMPLLYKLAAKIIGAHTNMTISDTQKRHYVKGMGGSGPYSKGIEAIRNPKIDSYEIDLERLARALPEEKRQQFKEIFLKNLEEVTDKSLTFPGKRQTRERLKTLLCIEPRHKPEEAVFTEPATSICTEYVMRSIIEATVLTFKELGEQPPHSLSYFGLKSRQNMLLLAPAALERRLKKAKIVKPLNNIERIIRF